MKYIIYARRSSEDKSKQIQSIPSQIEWATTLAKSRKIEVIKNFSDVKSGKAPYVREGFKEMMEFVHQSKASLGILCWKIDRLARNPIDEGALKYAFMQGKIKHILASDREFREGENQILMGVEFGAATQYSINLSKDVRRGMKDKVNKGWKPGTANLGYRNDYFGMKGDKKIFRDEERWLKVQALWRLLLTGAHTVTTVVNVANDELQLRTQKGRKLSTSTAYRVFTNIFYAGCFEWNGELKQGSHEPMITLEEFDKVQEILGKNGKPRKSKHEHIYTGCIRCKECGCMITAEPPKKKVNPKTGKVHTYNYLRCSKKRKDMKCSQKYILVGNLEQQIVNVLQAVKISPFFYEWAIKELQKQNKDEMKQFAQKRGYLLRDIEDNEGMIETLTEKLLKGIIDDETYKKSKQNFTEQRIHLQSLLKKYDAQKDQWLQMLEQDFDFASNAYESFQSGGVNKKREILHELGSNFFLEDQKLLIEVDPLYQRIVQVNQEENAIKARLELVKPRIEITKNALSDACNLIWSG